MTTKVNQHELKVMRGLENYDRIYATKLIHIETMDITAGDPEFQQCLMEVQYTID